MKIVIVNDYSDSFGGAEISINFIKKVLIDNGNKVFYFNGKKSVFSFFSRIFSIFYAIKFYLYLKNKKIDIIHYHKINLVLSPSLFIIGKVLGIKQVITFHDYGLMCPDGWMINEKKKPCKYNISYKCIGKTCGRNKINKNFYIKNKLYVIYNFIKNKLHLFLINKYADKIIFPSRNLMKYGTDIFSEKKMVYLPNFIEIEKKYSPNFEKINDKKFLFVGRLSKEKGLDVAIKAFNILVNKEGLKDIIFEIIGDGPEKNNLINLVKKLKLENNIKFLGRIENEKLKDYYESSVGLIMPSIWLENNPLVAIEGLKFGKSIIATNIGGYPDLVENNKNGYLFSLGNYQELAEKIKNLYKNKDLYIMFGNYSFKKLNEKFGSEKFYKKLIIIYNK